MAILVDTFAASLDAVLSAAGTLPTDLDAVKAITDDELLAAQRALAEARRTLDACASLVAGEVGHRSRRDLGYSGLAQREGFRTAEALVQHATGSTARDAVTLVQVGGMVHDAVAAIGGISADPVATREPWLTDVGAAVNAGRLSIEAARAIRAGLGSPTADMVGEGITSNDLANAVGVLLLEARSLNADQLCQRARQLRDDLDVAGIARREAAIHAERSLRRVLRPNGMRRYILDTDLESGAFWDDIYDKVTAPRRGGPRFVDKADRAWADAVADDTRTMEQYVHDSITQLLHLGVDADLAGHARIVGSRQPAVRVLVTERALASRAGHGHIEGVATPISIETVERIACSAGTISLLFDDSGQALNLGREQRLFTGRQRIALAARDGGCRWPGCDRPPGWTEAHHVQHWKRDNGQSDIADGLLLCRHHHMLLHNNHWEIRRDAEGGGEVGYWLVPPADIDAKRMPRLMPSKSAVLRELLRSNAG
jgi:hypothetical protein